MIRKYTEYSIECDICELGSGYKIEDWHPNPEKFDNWYHIHLDAQLSIKEMRELSKKYDWIRKNKKDICPMCQNKMKDKKCGK